jgi:preprotein translocase subunit SecD
METRYSQIISILLIALGIIAAIFIEPGFFNIDKEWKDFSLGLDLQGGVELLYEIDLSEIEENEHKEAVGDLRDVIEKRINVLGVKEPEIESVLTSEGYRLKVRIPGITDPNEAVKQIGRTPFLQFQKPKPNYLEIIENELEENPFEPTELTGRYLKKASAVTNDTSIEYFVELEFDETGKELFADLTEEFVGQPIAIFIDGYLISWPKVQEKIASGSAVINGGFGLIEAKDLATNLNNGALPVPLGDPISQITIGPTLGIESLNKSINAGLIGIIAVVAFLLIIYKLPGFLSAISLLIYGLIVLAFFKLSSITLTLAGIGGFILSIGMAVDANVLIFSRLREELREGKTLQQSVDQAFLRAWPSIRDGNFTTLIVALILFGVGTSFVQGFAMTLIIGLLLSIFASMVITKNFLLSFARTKKGRKLWL